MDAERRPHAFSRVPLGQTPRFVTRKCRFCGEDLQGAALACHHCGWAIATRAQLDKVRHDWLTLVAWGVGILAALILFAYLGTL